MSIQKSEIQSAIATAIICAIILLILLFCGMTAHRNEMDEGVMISLGYADEGYGEQTPSPAPITPQPPTPQHPATTPSTPKMPDEDLMTQEDPSVALRAEQERKRKEEEARIEAERIAREKREAQIKAEQEAKQKMAGALASSAFQNKGSGQGATQGSTQQGNPVGKGSQGGNSWSLNGRNLLGRLAQPSYQGNQEGTIVVEIRVDNSGKVTSASIKPAGTTISDESMRKASVEAALKNRFSSGNGVAIGTITYKFTLN